MRLPARSLLGFISGVALVGAAWACSSDDDGNPSTPTGGAGGSANEGGNPNGNGGETSSGAAAGEPTEVGGGSPGGANSEGGSEPTAGQTGSGGSTGGTDNLGGFPAIEPGVCDVSVTWGNPEPLAGISTAGADETLLALTADELTLVFERDGAVYRSERASAAGAWGTPVSITLPAGYGAAQGVALSQDGLRLVLLRDDRLAFGQVTRASRTDDFGASVDTTPFTLVNNEGPYQNYDFSSPLFAPSDQTFYYVGVYGDSFVFPCAKNGEAWSSGAALFDATTGTAGTTRLITGLSADERVIFMFDETLGYVVGLGRDTLSAPFKPGPTFPDRVTVRPSLSCQQLYTTRLVDESLDIVLETPE